MSARTPDAANGRARLLGVGNRFRGDDGVGLAVVSALSARLPDANVGTSDGEISGLLAEFEQHRELILIDAMDAGAAGVAPGTIMRLDAGDPALQDTGLRASTHAMGVAEAIALARTLGSLPPRCTVIAIAGSCFDNSEGLSRVVSEAADNLVNELAREFDYA